MISTKHKIIIIVFGIVALTYVVMYFIEQNAEAKRVERFAEESDDEELYEDPPKATPKPESKATPKPVATKASELSLASIMNQVTSYVQNKVSKDKQTSTFKDLFSEKNLSKLIQLNSPEDVQTFIDSVISEDESPTETFVASASFVKEKVESIKANLKKVEEDIDQLSQSASIAAMPTPTPTPPRPASAMPTLTKPEPEKANTTNTIEGFENVRYSFATY
jgi:hypothetical protein